MPDRKVFYSDPDLDRIETRTVDSGEIDLGPWVRLEETIFYPEGGGQPGDRGTIAGVPVVDVRSRGDQVLHILEHPIKEGSVTAVLDVERRFDHRQQHTAQHLLTAILLDRHDLRTTAFHLGESYSAIEVSGPGSVTDRLPALEAEVNAAVRSNPPVRTRWLDPEEFARVKVRSRGLPEGHTGPVRIVEIEGFDRNTCGGTHVRRLSEVQVVHLIDARPARGGIRIRFLAGNRVLQRLRAADAVDSKLKAMLGTGPEGFAEVLVGQAAERRRLEGRVKRIEADLAERLGDELAGEAGPRLLRHLPGAERGFLDAVAAATVAHRPDAVVALVGEGCFLVRSGPEGPEDVSELGARLAEDLGGKGGGRGRFFQGTGGTWTDDLAGYR